MARLPVPPSLKRLLSGTSAAQTTAGTVSDVADLLRRRGFLAVSSGIYGGLSGTFDLGPLAVKMKQNIATAWIRDVVNRRKEVHMFESPVLTPSSVLEVSGHVQLFGDELVEDRVSGMSVRADHCVPLKLCCIRHQEKNYNAIAITAPDEKTISAWSSVIKNIAPNSIIVLRRETPNMLHLLVKNVDDKSGEIILHSNSNGMSECTSNIIKYSGYSHPITNSPFLSAPRTESLLYCTKESDSSRQIYLRPETAQGAYTAMTHFAKALRLTLPFGLAQIGKVFRKEIRPESTLFRMREFEQMELQYFVAPEDAEKSQRYWATERLNWWQKYACNPSSFRLRKHNDSELAHYADSCDDIEYKFPWGWGEIEGVANRTDYDLQRHSAFTGANFEIDYSSGSIQSKSEQRAVPFVIESSAGLSRALLTYLYDAFEITIYQASGSKGTKHRTVLRLHPKIAPYTVAVMPIVVNNSEIMSVAHSIFQSLCDADIDVLFLEKDTVGKRYRFADETGIPICLTIDDSSLSSNGGMCTVTLRNRDSRIQDKVPLESAIQAVQSKILNWQHRPT